jgi:hypothetical protein
MDKKDIDNVIFDIARTLNDAVFDKIYDILKQNSSLRKNLNPAFPFPRELRIGFLQEYLVVEYLGPEQSNEKPLKVTYVWRETLLDFLEIDIAHLNTPRLLIPNGIENCNLFLGDSLNPLSNYLYNFVSGRDYSLINGIFDFDSIKEPIHISNSTFFWTDEAGALKIRRIDFLEVWPARPERWVYPRTKESFSEFAEFIIQCSVPTYEVKLHETLNRFIELIHVADIAETTVTKFLAEHPEILQLALGANRLNPQVLLEWQYPTNKDNLQPDFMPVGMDGYADIVEFKLPYLKSKPIVGSDTRSHPSYEIDSALAQLDEYDYWCSQEIHQKWLLENKNIKVKNPQRYLIIGHSKDFPAEERQKLRSRRNTVVLTYDEFIQMARFQLYRAR